MSIKNMFFSSIKKLVKFVKKILSIQIVLVVCVLGMETLATWQAQSFCEWAKSGKSFAEITQAAFLQTAAENYRPSSIHGIDQDIGVSVWIHRSLLGSYFNFDRKSYVEIIQTVAGATDVVDYCDDDASDAADASEEKACHHGDASIDVIFTGIPPFSRHICTIYFKRGEVTGTKIGYLD